MPDAHDLAVALDDFASLVSDESGKLNAQGLQPADPGYDEWMSQIAELDTYYDQLENAATKLDTAYGAQRLAGLESNLQSITAATKVAQQAIQKIAQINDVLQLVAAAAAAATAIAATVANPVVGGPTLIASAQAFTKAVQAYNKDTKSPVKQDS